MRNNALSLFKALPDNKPPRFETAGVLAVGNGTVDVRMADGTIYRHIPIGGGAIVGGTVNVQFVGGVPQAWGAGGSGGGAGGLVIGGGSGGTITGSIVAGAGLTGGGTLGAGAVTIDAGAGDGISVSSSAIAVDSSVVRTSRTITAGDGLTGGGALSGDVTINAVVANTGATGLTIEANAIRLTSSSAPGAAASILASDASGFLTLPKFVATTKVTTPLIDTSSGALTLNPTSDIVLTAGSNLVKLSASGAIQSANYASQTTGFRVNYAGEGDFRYLFTDELHAKAFFADLEQALAGGQIICKSVAVLYSDFTMPAGGSSATFVVRDLPSATGMRVFEERDIIRFRSFSRSAGSLSITDAWGEVTLDTSYGTSGFDSATKTQRYTYLRRQSVTIDDQNNETITDQSSDAILSSNITTPEGSMSGGTVIAADAIVLDYGKNQGGFHEVNAIDGLYGLNSPYAQIVSWQVHPKNPTVRTRTGNLRGIYSVDNEYGIYAGSGTSSADQYIRASTVGVALNNVPLALYSAGSQRVNIDSAGTDVWFSSDGGTTKQFHWTGSRLALNDATLSLTGSGAGLITLAGTSGVVMSAGGIIGTNSSGKPSFTLINSTQTVNGESLAAGDTMLGDNSSGKPNILFDESAAQLKFRGGTTTQAYVDTDGSIVAGGGTVALDSSGVAITHNTAYNSNPGNTDPQSLKFYSTGYNVGGAAGTYQLAAIKKYDFTQSITKYKGLDFNILTVYEPIGGSVVRPTLTFSFDGTRAVSFNGPNGTVDVDGALYTSGDATIAGKIGDTLTAPTFNTGWGNYGGGFQNAKYKKAGDLVYLTGLCLRSSGSATTIFTLPSGYRPASRCLFTVSSNSAWARVDVYSSGAVDYIGGGDPAIWVSLDGISFSTT
jgi:hypothetical protein